ncbi:MAG: electron transport complex subunit E [Betaproteobacteria bacterium]
MITWKETKTIFTNGAWTQNSSLVQMLGMCPTLAITTSLVNGFMMSMATIIVMSLSGFVVACLRNFIPHEIRIPVFILIAAAMVSLVDLSMAAYMPDIHKVLGIFIPLIITNCLVLARIEAFAVKNGPIQSFFDGTFMGVGMLWTLSILGGLRELIGAGSLFSGIEAVIPTLHGLQLLPQDYPGFLVSILPPGAFIVLAFMVAAKNWFEASRAARRHLPIPAPASTGGCH